MIDLAPYAVGYSILQSSLPTNTEIEVLVMETAAFLDGIFKTDYPEIDRLDTVRTSVDFKLGIPFMVEYKSKAIFPPGTDAVPTPVNMEILLMSVFSGANKDRYLEMLQALPPENVFCKCSQLNEACLVAA